MIAFQHRGVLCLAGILVFFGCDNSSENITAETPMAMMDASQPTDVAMSDRDLPPPDMTAPSTDAATADSAVDMALATDMRVPVDADTMNAVACPPIEDRPEPTIVSRFEDGGPEIEVSDAPFRVIAPEGHMPLAQHTLAVLPSCHAMIQSWMGYCHPWREAIVHYGRFEASRAKAENGVVYIGRTEASLSRLDDPSVWLPEPALCGNQTTLAHETVHTFQPAELPAWVKEGWADYIGLIVVGGNTYECGETSLCIRPPNPSGRPQPEECPNPVEYWDLSDPDWGGTRPEPGEDRDGQTNTSNKGRYYKTGTCFWQTLLEHYGEEQIRAVLWKMYTEPRLDLPVFPFSEETNALLITTYFESILGSDVWGLVARYGIVRPTEP